MAMRNLTEPYILMRNNALQSKHIYAEQHLSDRMALVAPETLSNEDVELKRINSNDGAPPVWTDALEETQYVLSRLRVKIDNLMELHAKQLTRPTLDDSLQEEKQMEQLTREISRAFSSGYRQVQIIKNAARHERRSAERQLALSAVTALSSALQEQGLRYRSAQNHYLQQINSREERNRQFFDQDNILVNNSMSDSWIIEGMGASNDEYNDDFWRGQGQPQQQQKQESVLLQLEDCEEKMKVAVEREQEVQHIVQSISDLNYIFKDLANMVQDQGTVLDRIDYNVEQTQVQVQEGYRHLKKADAYQRANRKLYCILILAVAIIFVSFLIIVFKT